MDVAKPSGITGGNPLNRQTRDEDRVQLVDNVTLSSGKHTMKFGVDVTWSSIDLSTEFNPNGGLIYKVDRDAPIDSTAIEDQVAQTYLRVFPQLPGPKIRLSPKAIC